MQTVSDTIGHLRLGEATTFEGLSVFPLFGEHVRHRDYLTLDEALEKNLARVVEVSEQGDVPNLLFENLGDRKVLLVDGDELVGAKQNRIINLTILVPAHTKIEIPVSCVEAGRWSYRGREFKSAERAMFSRGRARKAEQVTVCMRSSGDRYSDQSEVWNDVASCSESFGVDSPTGSMSDIYESNEQRLGKYREAFKAHEGQIGALFAINGAAQGLELFDSSETFGHYLERLVSSYALDSRIEKGNGEEADLTEVERFIEGVKNASTEPFAALGEGEDLRLSGELLAGGALVAEERVVHLAAFNLDPENKVTRRRPGRWFSDGEEV